MLRLGPWSTSMVDMVLSALVFYRIAEDNGTLPQWCVLVSLRSTLFDNLACRTLVLKRLHSNRFECDDISLMTIIVDEGGLCRYSTLVSCSNVRMAVATRYRSILFTFST